MREPRSEQAREKRELAALIRRYAAGLEDADRQDLTAYAESIEAEAAALDIAPPPLRQATASIGKSRETYEDLKARTATVFDALLEALKAIGDRVPDFDSEGMQAGDAFRTVVRIARANDVPEARYLVQGLGGRLELHVQLNVYRLVAIYSIPSQKGLDSSASQARFARWAAAAADTRWKIRWRESCDEAPGAIEVSCRATLPIDFLQDERHQLYWITELVQMTQALLLDARGCR